MDDNAPSENNPPADLNKIDLSQLQGFSFGTQWVQDKSSPSDRGGRDSGGDRPRREDRRDGPGPGGPVERRDRRAFRKPAGAPGDNAGPAPSATPSSAPGAAAPERQDYSGARAPR